MNITAVYTINKKRRKAVDINNLNINKLMKTGKAVYEYAFPRDLDYLIELESLASNALGVILFRISDTRIPTEYSGNDVNPRVSDHLFSGNIEEQRFYKINNIPIAEITFNQYLF